MNYRTATIARRIQHLERGREVKSDHADFRLSDGRILRLTKDAALQGCEDAINGNATEAAKIILNSTHTKHFGKLAELARMVAMSPRRDVDTSNLIDFPTGGSVQ